MSHMVDAAQLERASKRHSRVNWAFATAAVVLFIAYILVNLLASATLGQPVSPRSSVTWAVLLGYGAILGSVLLTGIYLLVSRYYVDPLIEQTRRECCEQLGA